jgi:uroporphyrinogen decarboxylase
MTPKERAVAALTLKVPDMVPTFELEFQLEEEMFGRKFITEDLKRKDWTNSHAKKRKKGYTSLLSIW